MAPVRIQLSRKKGFNLQAASKALNGLEAVNVARPSKWGNPFIVNREEPGSQKRAVDLYRTLFTSKATLSRHDVLRFLRGNGGRGEGRILELGLVLVPDLRNRNLACWCKPGDPCHADVLLELANPVPPHEP